MHKLRYRNFKIHEHKPDGCMSYEHGDESAFLLLIWGVTWHIQGPNMFYTWQSRFARLTELMSCDFR